MGWKGCYLKLLLHITILLASCTPLEAAYKVGVGRADCTGPSAEITFMGYAKAGQRGCGIHLRQFSRAFVFEVGTKRAAFVTVDACMMTHGVRKAVLEELEKKYTGVFTEENLILSGTHTHSGPGGFLMHVLYDFPNLGFLKQTFNALVDGIVRSVERAKEHMVDAKLYVNSVDVKDSNINRSPAAYLFNPIEEREKYEHDTDTEMVQLKIVSATDNSPIGAIQWFPVHPTSMNNTNCLVSSDNVGYASILLETSVDKDSLPGQSNFVGAFASTNLGDVSPNTKGPYCMNSGEPCETVTSTCNGQARQCVSRGPGRDMFDSTKIIATNLFEKAFELLKTDGTEVSDDLRYIHQFVHMPSEEATYTLDNGTNINVKGCLPAMGVGFAAGTTDGPGEFDFHQASNTTNSTNPFWYIVRDLLSPPTPEDVACHAPKPILLMTGRIKIPYEWQPEVVSIQYIKLGQVVLAAVPGEFTTMSGRRMRETIRKKIIASGGSQNTKVILTGLSNVYTSYIATPEEYGLQRYEGASTIFGPHTLTIYLKLYENLAEELMQGVTSLLGPSPYEFPPKEKLLSLTPGVLFDSAGWFNNFGECIKQPPQVVHIGDEVSVKFISGHPRNNLRQEDTFLKVEKKTDSDSGWKVVATDASWDTKFIWRRTNAIKGSSEVEIIWNVGNNVEPGTYRIRHFGDYKYIFGGIYAYEGRTIEFQVVNQELLKENMLLAMK